MKWKVFTVVVGLLLVGLLMVGCGATPEPCPECPEAEACPDCPAPEPCPDCPAVECPEPEACPDCPECPEAEAEAGAQVPFEELWAGSGHADAEAEAFVHWDEDDPAVVPANCAKCHSEGGYLDFLGADGTEAGTVDGDHAIGTSVTCVACHNDATAAIDSVVMPSGVELTGLGAEARCMECHQGRASKLSVDNAIAEAAVADDDTVSEDLGFTNIHYYAAAATQAGGEAMGGYQYDGKAYDSRFDHVEGYDTCVECHNSHTLELKIEECATCHAGVASADDLKDVRMQGSLVDFDGDGDMDEGIYYEIEGLQGKLYEAIQAYGTEVSGTPIVYDSHAYPYFFIDTNADGQAGEDEANYGNQYNAWTGRLAKAAYNYQTSLKDPGAYAHGGKYIIQLLHDSTEDLNQALSAPVDLSSASRIDHGHFAGSEEAFRHWDEDDPAVVSASCAKCHSAEGLPFYLETGVQIEAPTANGLACASCHDDVITYTIHEVAGVEFPSGAEVDSGDPASNLCLNCHQGRESTASVDRRIGDADDDAVTEGLGFANVHYFAAGATLFGDEVQGAYQYEGKDYVGRNSHVEPYSNCVQCHSTHMLEVKADECSACHPGVEDVADIRMDSTDYDGDGDTAEGIAGEIETMQDTLYAGIQDYAANTIGTAIVYDSHAYPYFFIDTDGDGEPGAEEANYGNQYATWTPELLRAAYNYQYAQKDPGAYAHNPLYVLQALHDSLEAMGVDVSGMTRPESSE